MHGLKMFALLAFPIFVFSSSLSNQYVESFSNSFQQKKFLESLQTLDEWEAFEPELKCKITGMKAAVYFSVGKLEEGSLLMSQFICGLSD